MPGRRNRVMIAKSEDLPIDGTEEPRVIGWYIFLEDLIFFCFIMYLQPFAITSKGLFICFEEKQRKGEQT